MPCFFAINDPLSPQHKKSRLLMQAGFIIGFGAMHRTEGPKGCWTTAAVRDASAVRLADLPS